MLAFLSLSSPFFFFFFFFFFRDADMFIVERKDAMINDKRMGASPSATRMRASMSGRCRSICTQPHAAARVRDDADIRAR